MLSFLLTPLYYNFASDFVGSDMLFPQNLDTERYALCAFVGKFHTQCTGSKHSSSTNNERGNCVCCSTIFLSKQHCRYLRTERTQRCLWCDIVYLCHNFLCRWSMNSNLPAYNYDNSAYGVYGATNRQSKEKNLQKELIQRTYRAAFCWVLC